MSQNPDIGLASPKTCLSLWKGRAIRNSQVNHAQSEQNRTCSIVFTHMNVLLGVIVMYSSLAPWMEKYISAEAKDILISVAGLCVVITTIVQVLMDFDYRAMQHENAALEYGRINREIEQIQSIDKDGASLDDDTLMRIRNELDWIARIAVSPPKRIWDKHFTPTSELAKTEQKFGKDH